MNLSPTAEISSYRPLCLRWNGLDAFISSQMYPAEAFHYDYGSQSHWKKIKNSRYAFSEASSIPLIIMLLACDLLNNIDFSSTRSAKVLYNQHNSFPCQLKWILISFYIIDLEQWAQLKNQKNSVYKFGISIFNLV